MASHGNIQILKSKSVSKDKAAMFLEKYLEKQNGGIAAAMADEDGEEGDQNVDRIEVRILFFDTKTCSWV